ncbi:MAG: hypothetical protein QM831_36640 [Kofleriaceae bacterium]
MRWFVLILLGGCTGSVLGEVGSGGLRGGMLQASMGTDALSLVGDVDLTQIDHDTAFAGMTDFGLRSSLMSLMPWNDNTTPTVNRTVDVGVSGGFGGGIARDELIGRLWASAWTDIRLTPWPDQPEQAGFYPALHVEVRRDGYTGYDGSTYLLIGFSFVLHADDLQIAVH